MLQVDAALDITDVNWLKSDGSNKLADRLLCTGIVSAEQHRGLQRAIASINGVSEIFVTVNIEAVHNMRFWKKLLHNFTTALASAAVSQASTNRIGAVYNSFSDQVKTLDAFGNSGVRAAYKHERCAFHGLSHIHGGKAGSFSESRLSFGGVGIASGEDDMFSKLEELRSKSRSDADQVVSVRNTFQQTSHMICYLMRSLSMYLPEPMTAILIMAN